MKIVVTSIGTRGDVEPFLAIGKMLKAKGHDVIGAFTEKYREETESNDLTFASLGSKYDALFDTEIGRIIMGSGTGFQKFAAYMKLARNQEATTAEKERKLSEVVQREQPDRILYHSKNIYPLLWEARNPGQSIFISPFPYMHYVAGHPFLTFRKSCGAWIDKLTFRLYDFGVISSAVMAKKWVGASEKISRKRLKEIIRSRKFVYTISPHLFPRPADWTDNITVLGHQALDSKTAWQPDAALTDFISRHEKILFVTFGSMLNAEPDVKTRIILDILERHNIPAIINTAYGGLVEPPQYNSDLIHFVKHIPYEWAFPRMHAVMHHGGAGTTHLAVKHGCASMIIPHFIDQFHWDEIISRLGLGPRGIKIGRLSDKTLEAKILDLFSNPAYKTRSEEMGRQMQQENFEEALHRMITQ